jgi:hypothetical protein
MAKVVEAVRNVRKLKREFSASHVGDVYVETIEARDSDFIRQVVYAHTPSPDVFLDDLNDGDWLIDLDAPQNIFIRDNNVASGWRTITTAEVPAP